jgi:hypothetical protein
MRWSQRYKQFLERKKSREKHGERHAHTGTVLRRSFEDRHVMSSEATRVLSSTNVAAESWLQNLLNGIFCGAATP